jgi:hypothetical protein
MKVKDSLSVFRENYQVKIKTLSMDAEDYANNMLKCKLQIKIALNRISIQLIQITREKSGNMFKAVLQSCLDQWDDVIDQSLSKFEPELLTFKGKKVVFI